MDDFKINFDSKSSSEDEKNYTADIVKIIIKDDSYVAYNLKNNSIINKFKDIDSLIEKLLINDFNNVSRILKFQYLLNDINDKTLTMSHPYIFEDKKESIYGLENKVYMLCFSNTTGKENAYAWWNIYGKTPDDSLDNIKVRIIFNKRDLLKNILLKKDKNFAYYFGDIKYIKEKKEDEEKKEENENIKDFFEKNDSFQFENEFRVLIEYIGTDEEYNDKYKYKYSDRYKIFFKLDVDSELYKDITSKDRLYFDNYKNIDEKYTNAVKYFLKEAQDKI